MKKPKDTTLAISADYRQFAEELKTRVATARFGWSRNVLLNQIKTGAYERAVTEKKTHNFDLALPEHFAEQADEMLKSSYNLEFLGVRRAVREWPGVSTGISQSWTETPPSDRQTHAMKSWLVCRNFRQPFRYARFSRRCRGSAIGRNCSEGAFFSRHSSKPRFANLVAAGLVGPYSEKRLCTESLDYIQ